jgi:hypothetical protein
MKTYYALQCTVTKAFASGQDNAGYTRFALPPGAGTFEEPPPPPKGRPALRGTEDQIRGLLAHAYTDCSAVRVTADTPSGGAGWRDLRDDEPVARRY